MVPKSSPYVVAGIDEAGRGCLAGPVVAGAVILPKDYFLPGLGDSKAVSPRQRAVLSDSIKAQAVSWALGFSWPKEIDCINILQATLHAMDRAYRGLNVAPNVLLVDGNKSFAAPIPLQTVIGGDALIPAISAASILAKTSRDHLMQRLALRYPEYGFERHKGYGTREHFTALRALGPSPLHRKSFRGVLPPRERELCLPLP